MRSRGSAVLFGHDSSKCRLYFSRSGSRLTGCQSEPHLLWRLPFCLWYYLGQFISLFPDSQTDTLPKSPYLTLTQEVASLLNRHDSPEMPAVLFHGGNNKGSAITLKGSDGGRLVYNSNILFRLLMRLSRGDVGLHYLWGWDTQ